MKLEEENLAFERGKKELLSKKEEEKSNQN